MDQDNETLIDSRGLVRLCYSSTFGNSKANAMRFQDELEKHHFIAPIINVGDYSTEEFSLYRGTLLLFLSTYGDGGAPRDG